MRSATHSRLGAGGPEAALDEIGGRAVAGSAIVVLRALPRVVRQAEFGHRRSDGASLATSMSPRFIGPLLRTVNTVVGGVDAAEFAIAQLAAAGLRLMWS